MKNVAFGIGQLRAKTPEFIHWVSVSGAALLTAMAGLQAIYPQYVTEHMIAETAKVLAAIRIIGQFFGVEPVATEKPNEQ